MNLLPPNLASVADLCADESARYSLTGVHLRVTPDSYVAEATDGRVAVRVSGPCDSAAEYPALPALASAPNGASEGLIPVSDWKAAFKAVPKAKRYNGPAPVLRNVAVVLGAEQATLATTDGSAQTVLAPRHVEGRFPDVDSVFPKVQSTVRVTFDPRKLIQVLKAALPFLPEDGESVTLEFYPDRVTDYGSYAQPARITTKNGAQTFDALVMPLSK